MTEQMIWTPLQFGPVTVSNRIVFSAHLTNYAEGGLPTEQHAAYYAERAKGGAGLIITEEHSTHPTDWPYEKLIHGFNREVIPGYRRITDAVHRHRVPIFAQINHSMVHLLICKHELALDGGRVLRDRVFDIFNFVNPFLKNLARLF